MLYFDGQHLVADSETELHEFAKNVLRFPRSWYHDKYLKGPRKGQPNTHPHYDVLAQGKKVIVSRYPDVKMVKPEEIDALAKRMLKGEVSVEQLKADVNEVMTFQTEIKYDVKIAELLKKKYFIIPKT